MNESTEQPAGAVVLRPRRPGEIQGAAFDLYRRHLLPLLAIVAAAVVPFDVLNWQTGSCPGDGCRITVFDGVVVSTSVWTTTASAAAVIVLLFAFGALLAVTTRTITAEFVGEDPSVRRSYRYRVPRPGSLLQVSILVVVAAAALLLLNLPGIFLTGSSGPLASLGFLAGLLLSVAGLFLGVRLAASIPAVVVEGQRWPQALARSWSLASGLWWHVFGTLFLAFLAVSFVGTIIRLPLGDLLVGDGWLAQALVRAAITTLTLPYFLSVLVLLYLDLRARKEHLDLDTLKADLQASETTGSWGVGLRPTG
jgi:hypothetical protein